MVKPNLDLTNPVPIPIFKGTANKIESVEISIEINEPKKVPLSNGISPNYEVGKVFDNQTEFIIKFQRGIFI